MICNYHRVILGYRARWQPEAEEEKNLDTIEVSVSPLAPDEARLIIEGCEGAELTRGGRRLASAKSKNLAGRGAPVRIEGTGPALRVRCK